MFFIILRKKEKNNHFALKRYAIEKQDGKNAVLYRYTYVCVCVCMCLCVCVSIHHDFL